MPTTPTSTPPTPAPAETSLTVATFVAFMTASGHAQQILKARMLTESNLQYQEHWDAFCHEGGYDAQKQNRAEWVAIKLAHSGPKGAEVTLGDWRTFQARFTAARARVADRTKAEEHQMVFRQLTPKMQEVLLREQSKRRASRPWVSIVTPGRIPLNDVLAEMRDQLGGLLPTTETTRAGCIVQCATAEMRDRFLHFSGWEFEGQSIEVTRYEYEMTSEETFEFFLQRLRVDQELSATRATYGCTVDAEISQNSPQSRTPPTKVTIVEPAVSRDKRQTCGDSGKGTATGIVSWVDQKETVRRPPKGSAESRDRQARAVEAQVAQALASRAFEQSSPRTSPRTRDD